MVTRRYLTSDYVNEVRPPIAGEVWIADTAVRGFGLRLWATKSGGQKAFAIRVSDWTGRSIRKSYSGSWHFGDSIEAALEGARRWAQDEIWELKLSPNKRKKSAAIERGNRKKILKLTLGEAAESMIRVMQLKGLNERYVDRIDKLFSSAIPERIRKKNITSVTPKEIARALVLQKISGPNSRILRSFISQLFLHITRHHTPSWQFSKRLSDEFWHYWEKHADVRFPELRKLQDIDFQRLFQVLEDDEHWQQALAIRLYFKFTTSMTRIQSAEWSHVLDGTWYPFAPGTRKFWKAYEQRLMTKRGQFLPRSMHR